MNSPRALLGGVNGLRIESTADEAPDMNIRTLSLLWALQVIRSRRADSNR
jgi:hypothetical protein